jgi:nucleoside-diphosphate kinase
MERTCFLIKPDAVAAGHTDAIMDLLRAKGYFIAKRRDITVTRELVRELYSHRSKEPTFEKLLAYMISGPMVVLLLTKVGALNQAQRLCGPKTKKEQDDLDPAAEKPLRVLYGIDEMRNAVHCSDSAANAAREIALLFPRPALKDLSSQEYLADVLEPGLNEFLQHIAKVRPPDVYTATADWFLANRPRELEEEWFPEPVFTKGFVLKSDEWEGVHNEKQLGKPIHAGVWNLHRAKGGLSIYGVGQCRADGLHAVAEKMLGEPSIQQVLWINTREEPVCFLDGMPVAIREESRPNEHVQHLAGVEGFEVAAMEERFLLEIHEKLSANGGRIEVLYQRGNPDALDNEATETKVDGCQTANSIFEDIVTHGLKVEFLRFPMTDQGPPNYKAFDQVVNALKMVSPKRTAVVVNDDFGVGRCTLMMCCVYLPAH